MIRFRLGILVLMLLLSICIFGPHPTFAQPPTPTPPVFNLDHFKAYNIHVKEKKLPEVSVQDQFMPYRPEKINPDRIRFFANPVSKDNAGKKDEFAHLTWYRIRKDKPEKEITYLNQFTEFKPNKITVRKLSALLVPTEKIEKNSQFPKNLDHYLCYQVVTGFDRSKQITLDDQFQEKVTTSAGGPEYFCNPSSKNNDPIKNNEDHLAVYVLGRGKEVDKEITIKNQFKKQSLKVLDQVFLLVPTKKLKVSPPPGKHDDQMQ
ncbi:MAG TPA: hypothetical protein VGA95_12605 [Thermodesulfobacteriota bacterium]